MLMCLVCIAHMQKTGCKSLLWVCKADFLWQCHCTLLLASCHPVNEKGLVGDKDTHPCLSSVTQPHYVMASWSLLCPFLFSILFSDDTSNMAIYNSLAKTDREGGASARARREQRRQIKETSQHEEKITDGEREITIKGGKLYSPREALLKNKYIK